MEFAQKMMFKNFTDNAKKKFFGEDEKEEERPQFQDVEEPKQPLVKAKDRRRYYLFLLNYFYFSDCL
jgi:hypothetical protein